MQSWGIFSAPVRTQNSPSHPVHTAHLCTDRPSSSLTLVRSGSRFTWKSQNSTETLSRSPVPPILSSLLSCIKSTTRSTLLNFIRCLNSSVIFKTDSTNTYASPLHSDKQTAPQSALNTSPLWSSSWTGPSACSTSSCSPCSPKWTPSKICTSSICTPSTSLCGRISVAIKGSCRCSVFTGSTGIFWTNSCLLLLPEIFNA